jgi:hypothetical protein
LTGPGFSFDEVEIDLSDECFVVVDPQFLEEGLSDLVDVAHDHGGKEDLGKWNGHRIDGGHNLNKFSKSTLIEHVNILLTIFKNAIQMFLIYIVTCLEKKLTTL